MATLSKDKSRAKTGKRSGQASYRVQVYVDGVRKTIRLGKMPAKQADAVLRHVEALSAAKIDGSAPSESTATWLASLSDQLRERIVRVGLAGARGNRKSMTVGELIAQYREKKFPEFKPGTIGTTEQALRSVMKHFGAGTLVSEVTPGDADDFRSALVAQGLAEATTRKRCSIASTLFRYAQKHRVIDREPFADSDAPRASIGTKHRTMVEEADAQAVLEQLPDAQWRLLFGLSRWGGLRVGSEPRLLTWADVRWEHQRIRVRSPKTERHAGHEEREVPIFPELLPLLLEAQETAELGEELLLPFLRGRTDAALRKPLLAAIDRAGVTPWPRLWHSMRATRQTELEARFPTHVVCGWLGNSQRVAAKHYLMTTEGDFAKAAQNAAQHQPASGGTEGTRSPREGAATPEIPGRAAARHFSPKKTVSPAGLEPTTNGLKVRCSTN